MSFCRTLFLFFITITFTVTGSAGKETTGSLQNESLTAVDAISDITAEDQKAVSEFLREFQSSITLPHRQIQPVKQTGNEWAFFLFGVTVLFLFTFLAVMFARMPDKDGVLRYKVTVGAKLIGWFGLLIIMTVGAFMYALSTLGQLGTELENISKEVIPLNASVAKIQLYQVEQMSALSQAYRWKIQGRGVSTQRALSASGEFRKLSQLIVKTLEKATTLLELEPPGTQADANEMLIAIKALDRITALYKRYESLAMKALSYIEEGRIGRANLLEKHLGDSEISLHNEIDKFLSWQNDRTFEAVNLSEAKGKSTSIDIRFFAILLVVLGIFASWRMTNSIIRPVRALSKLSNRVAKGDLEISGASGSDDEIGLLGNNFRQVVESFKSVSDVCEAIAKGDFSKDVEIRSEKDSLGQAVNEMAKSLRAVVVQAERVAKGDYTTQIRRRSEQDQLGSALSDMTSSLSKVTSDNEHKSRIMTGQTELNNAMRGDQNLTDLSRSIITYLCSYLGARVGAFYVSEDSGVQHLVASYAYLERKNLSNEFRPGEGLIGQAVLEKTPISLTKCPEDYIRIGSGLGETVPSVIVVYPFLMNNEVKGVIELGLLQDDSNSVIDFLFQVSESVAMAVNSARARTRMTELLEKTTAQSEELQAQSEELRQTNEELEEQTKALRESEEELQAQQEELRVMNEELEEKTEELQAEKESIKRTNSELKKASEKISLKAKELAIASKYKSEFLANMSHELRTPLNSILILSQLLAENKTGRLNEKEIESARTINSSGNDLLSLINEVLDLSKVEAGKIEIEIDDTNLKDFITGVERGFRQMATEKNLNFTIEIKDDIPQSIATDKLRLNQIVKNLLSNAFKFTESGSVELIVSRPVPNDKFIMQSDLIAEKTVTISIIDSGIGIPGEEQETVFHAFKQADGKTSRKYGGTGLGLSISRELARLLGGEIHVHSREGEGATFTLYIPETMEKVKKPFRPARQAPVPEKSPPKLPSPPTTIEDISDDRRHMNKGDKTLLIIDDDPTFTNLLSDLSHQKGFKCLVAGSGETGLHLADYYQPSAIILDIGLPGMDGWQVMDHLKESASTRHIPVHFISAADKPIDGLKKGAIGYLTKPVNIESLDSTFNVIEDVISKRVKKVLLVEDDTVQRRAVTELIESNEVEVSAVATGAEALELLETEPFDCFILDLVLGDMTGFELLEKMRNNEKIALIPVIVYTGKDLSEEEEETLKAFSESIIIKGARSPERLLDQATLFLHSVEIALPKEKQRMIRMVHDREAVLDKKRVLIVDDDMRNVFAVSAILEGKGMNIVTAKNGKDCLDKLAATPDIDLILMDIMMPEMDGYEAMRRIRTQRKFKDMPIIALTAKAMRGDRGKCIEAGANDYMAKPIDSDKLISLLRVWLNR